MVNPGATFLIPLSLALVACSGSAAQQASQSADEVRSALSRRDFGEAATLARALAQKQPRDADVQFLLARTEALAGNETNALTALDAALANGLAKPLNALGDSAFDAMRNDEAFMALEVRVAPSSLTQAPEASVSLPPAAPAGTVSISEHGDHTVVRAGDVLVSD